MQPKRKFLQTPSHTLLPVSQCQLNLRTISSPCQSFQPNGEFCPSPYVVLKSFQLATFFRKKWKSKSFSITKVPRSGLHFSILKSRCQLRASTEEFSTPIAFPLPPPPIILLSSEHLNFLYHCKIYCVNLDLAVFGSAPRQHLLVYLALAWSIAHSYPIFRGVFFSSTLVIQ